MEEDVETAGRPPAITRGRLLRRAAVGVAGLTAAGSLLTGEGLATGRRRPSPPPHGGPADRVNTRGGLYDRVNRISGMVCNVSDLERAKEFWEKWTPLRAYARTTTPRQSFRSLGIRRGRFDGYLMRDMWDPGILGGDQFALHLVQWKDPAPVGKPYDSSRNPGWYRLGINTPDPLDLYNRLVAGGVSPYAPPQTNPPPPLQPISGFGYPDPDGITIQVLKGRPGLPDRVDHPAAPTVDVQRSWELYRDVIGLRLGLRASSCPIPNPWDRHGGSGSWEAVLLASRGGSPVFLDIVQFGGDARVEGMPYASPVNLGYAQIQIEVDDMRASYDILRRLERRRGADFRLAGPPEVWDLGPEVGERTNLVFYDWMGIRYQLVEAVPNPPEWNHPLPALVCPT